jgi:outer membrane protein assembly factor BamB
MAVVDWDGDGLDEAINVWPDAFYVVDGNGQNLVDRSFMGDVYGSLETQQGLPIVADFLANGSQTILHAGSQFVLALLDRLATPLWHTAYGSARTLWSPAVGDFDGDGDLDILSNAQNSATVSAYDGRTGTVRWSLALPGVPGAAVSGDIDGDGRDEALFAIGNTLYCVGAAPDGRSGRIEWTRTFSSAIGMPILADVTGTGQLQIVVVAQDGYVYGLA